MINAETIRLHVDYYKWTGKWYSGCVLTITPEQAIALHAKSNWGYEAFKEYIRENQDCLIPGTCDQFYKVVRAETPASYPYFIGYLEAPNETNSTDSSIN